MLAPHWAIRQWFSSQKAAFDKKMATALQKAEDRAKRAEGGEGDAGGEEDEEDEEEA